jgi:hypothetical protein
MPCVKYIIHVEVVCFDTLLQVLILKGLTLHQYGKCVAKEKTSTLKA